MIFNVYIKISLVVASIISFGVGHYYYKLADDNVVEEIAEMVIKQECGIDIDLTPDSPEIKK